MKKQLLFLSLMLLASARFASANYFVHNETNKYGYGNDITIYNQFEAGGIKIKAGETKEIKMNKNVTYDKIVWVDGNNLYETKSLRDPKDVFIYSPTYLTWEYRNDSEHALLPKVPKEFTNLRGFRFELYPGEKKEDAIKRILTSSRSS